MTEDQLREYCEYLNDNGIISTASGGSIIIDTVIENKKVIFNCAIDDTFPYRIPKISIDLNESDILPRMPHIDEKGDICAFDNMSIPNINNPKKLILDTVSKGVDIVESGLRYDNITDYLDEFNVYWGNESSCYAEMFLEDINNSKTILWCNTGKRMIVTDDDTELKRIVYSLDEETVSDEQIKEGLLIRLNSDYLKEVPKDDTKLFELIQLGSPDYKEYCSFFRRNLKKIKLLVINVMDSDNDILIGYLYPGMSTPKGFRKGHESLEVIFKSKHKEGVKVKINNCYHERLFQRGSDGKDSAWERVALIGCGSVGSLCVDALKLNGVKEFLLVDNDILEYENIARHACGYSEVGKRKVEALSKRLLLHNPNIVCNSFSVDAMTFIDEHNKLINENDVVIVAVGSLPIELYINKAVTEHKINKPLIIMWVEPFMVGGHAILIKRPQDLFEELFDETQLVFSHNIVKNPSQYLKREAGCNSSYMPYSGFELQGYVNRVIGHIINDCWDEKGNYLITWCGRISDAVKNGIEITEEYKSKDDYSIVTKRID